MEGPLKSLFFRWSKVHNQKKMPKGVKKGFVCFQSSSLKPLGKFESNLVGIFIGWSSGMFMFSFCWSEVHKKKTRFLKVSKGCCLFLYVGHLFSTNLIGFFNHYVHYKIILIYYGNRFCMALSWINWEPLDDHHKFLLEKLKEI